MHTTSRASVLVLVAMGGAVVAALERLLARMDAGTDWLVDTTVTPLPHNTQVHIRYVRWL